MRKASINPLNSRNIKKIVGGLFSCNILLNIYIISIRKKRPYFFCSSSSSATKIHKFINHFHCSTLFLSKPLLLLISTTQNITNKKILKYIYIIYHSQCYPHSSEISKKSNIYVQNPQISPKFPIFNPTALSRRDLYRLCGSRRAFRFFSARASYSIRWNC